MSAFSRQRLRSLVSKERSEDLLVLTELIEAGKVTPVIDRTYPLVRPPRRFGTWRRDTPGGRSSSGCEARPARACGWRSDEEKAPPRSGGHRRQRGPRFVTFCRAIPELTGDLGSGAAGGKQRAGLHADAFEGLAVTQTAGVAAVGGWSHAAMLPRPPRSWHRKGRTSSIVRRLSGSAASVMALARRPAARSAAEWVARTGACPRRGPRCRACPAPDGAARRPPCRLGPAPWLAP
jgi:hypothetical protein